MEDFTAAGYKIYGVSYDSVSELAAFSDQHGIGYDLLADDDSAVITQFGILNTLISPEGPLAGNFYGLPFPGTYVVDAGGVVTEKFFNKHYATRTSAGTLLDSALGRALRHEEAPAEEHGAPRARFTAFLSDPQLTLEVASTLNVRVDMEEGYHIYAEPLPDDYYPTTVRLEPVDGLEIGEPVYPPTMEMRFDALDVTLNVYEGSADIAFPVTAMAELFEGGRETVDLDVVVDYQVCSDTVCYLPEEVRLTLSAPISGLLER